MELALHIGTSRTGTATVQGWFAQARDWLAGHGVHYARTPGAVNHLGLTLYARDLVEGDHFFIRAGLRTPADMEAWRARTRRALHDELAATRPMRAWVMSNEHLYYMLTTPEMVARLHSLLAPRFDRIRIFLHLRPQVDLILAMAAQEARLGRRVTRAMLTRPGVGPENPHLDYRGIAERWAQVFGAEAVELVAFARQPCMVTHLAARLGLPVEGRPAVRYPDESLGWRSIALANCIDRPLLTPDRQVNLDREMFIDALPASEPLSLGADLARTLHARFAEDNAVLIRRWQAGAGARADSSADASADASARGPGLRTADLTPDWSAHAGPETLGALEAPCVFRDQLSAMTRMFNRALRRERGARLAAEAALAAARGDSARAEKLRRDSAEALQGLVPPDAPPADTPPARDA